MFLLFNILIISIDFWKTRENYLLFGRNPEILPEKNYNDGHILRIFDTLPFFFSPQVKRSVIISSKHGIYELRHELPNDIDLGNQEGSGKSPA